MLILVEVHFGLLLNNILALNPLDGDLLPAFLQLLGQDFEHIVNARVYFLGAGDFLLDELLDLDVSWISSPGIGD